MDPKQAIQDLELTVYLLIGLGLFGIIGTLFFWDRANLIRSVAKAILAIGFIYFGYLVLRSKKCLALISKQSARRKRTKKK